MAAPEARAVTFSLAFVATLFGCSSGGSAPSGALPGNNAPADDAALGSSQAAAALDGSGGGSGSRSGSSSSSGTSGGSSGAAAGQVAAAAADTAMGGSSTGDSSASSGTAATLDAGFADGAAKIGSFAPGTGFYWQLQGTVDITHPQPVFDIDIFDAAAGASLTEADGTKVSIPTGANAGAVDRLHAEGKRVICYFDTGAYESYRPDASLFPKSIVGNNTGWNGENYLDLRQASWPMFEGIILARMDLAVRMGCDGVEGDQNNPLGNNPGFPIQLSDEIAWYTEMANQLHKRGLAAIMKNGVEVLSDSSAAQVVALYEGALNEECNQYSECNVYKQFIAASKVVWNVEYATAASAFCPSDNSNNYDGYYSANPPDGTTWQPCR